MVGVEVSGGGPAMHTRFAVALRCVVAFLACSLIASAAAPSETRGLAGTALLSALRSGGYVLYFRHMATSFGQDAPKMSGYEDCANELNLTDAGRADARVIGAAIRSLGIPIGDVLASPFCRTRETAELIFGRATVAPAVRGDSGDAGRYAELRLLLSRRDPSGGNLAIASHRDPFAAVAGGPYLEEGEAAVIEPMGGAGFRVVARIRKDEWTELK